MKTHTHTHHKPHETNPVQGKTTGNIVKGVVRKLGATWSQQSSEPEVTNVHVCALLIRQL